MSTRICVVGGGVAGSLLAWRLAVTGGRDDAIELLTGPADAADATAASRGLVRSFETDPGSAQAAAASLAELLADPVLRQWAGYRRLGSTYVLADGPPDPELFAAVCSAAPGSVALASAEDLAQTGWRALPDSAVAVVEEEAGYIDPDRLRRSALADLAGRRAAGIVAESARAVRVDSDRVRVDFPSGSRDFDLVVVAAGPWTPAFLHACGLPAEGLTTKAIQYTVVPTRGPRPTAFVDETTGLFGRPLGDGMMFGLPTRAWGVDPDAPKDDPLLEHEALRLAALRFPALETGSPAATTVSSDCYATPAGLRLAGVPGTGGRILTFSGGSGGSAKTALAASAQAADDLRRR